MDLRDKNNTMEGYKSLMEGYYMDSINKNRKEIIELEESEKQGIQVHSRISNKEAIQNSRDSIYRHLYYVFFIKYSTGTPVPDLITDYIAVIDSMENVWKKSNGYVQMQNMLSVGILLDIESAEFNKLVGLIRKDNPKDYLIDLLINYKMPEWERVNKKFMWKKPYQAFEEIEMLAKNNKDEAIIRLKKYLQKQWLPSNNESYSAGKWYHSGYWSFESGATVKILDLDDAEIKDLKYYPYDMVHWKK